MFHYNLNISPIEMADAIPGGFFIYHADGDKELLYVNNEVLLLFGCESAEEFRQLTHNSFRGIVHPEDLERVEESIRDQIRSNSRNLDYVEYRIVRKDGAIRWVEDFGHLLHNSEYGDIFYVFISDITDTKKLLKEASGSEESLKSIYQDAIISDAHCFFEANLTANTLGENAIRTFTDRKLSLIEVIGMEEGLPFSDYAHGWADKMMIESADKEQFLFHADREHLLKLFSEGIYEDSVRFWTYNVLGEKMYVYQHYQIARDPESGDICVLSVIRDETSARQQRELVETALAQAEAASETRNRFLSSLSHDIRTPLNSIIGYAMLAENKAGDREKTAEYISKILSESKHLLSVFDDVLDMQRIESGRMKLELSEVNLSSLMHEIRKILRNQVQNKNQDFYIDVHNVKDQYVICDRKRLSQILLTILENAVKYNPAGGMISLKICEIPGLIPERPEFEFVIEDNGSFIHPEYLAHAFEYFKHGDHDDSGVNENSLGLALVKSIVQLMGGTIRFESEKQKGSTITITVPMRKTAAPLIAFSEEEMKNKRVLVVDDDFNTCDSVTNMLISMGASADWSMSGKDAINRAQLAAKRGAPFDLYIVDWQMPDINGVEVTRRLRELVGADIPVVVLTAYDWTAIEDDAFAAGVNGFLAKPLFETDFKQGLQKAFHPELQKEVDRAVRYDSLIGKRILLAEDNKFNQEITCELLKHVGIHVDVANHGAEAIDMLVRNGAGFYQLILMDISMPVMDGYTAAKEIRTLDDVRLAQIPIVALSANVFDEDRIKAIHSGMNEHIAKPIDLEELYTIMERVITL